ncbi:hypothetical protein AOQ84DRAFT_426268 [Glonium stellatum]|uniref:Beta-galactosidase jelly roll domain-containing protein n=1 Tax=Glonium stellatum TaxID=574774 RepID=A0A8E2JVJ2_9PEZI|nr:hypothetical protein AOQ84DRAFT_426268 [Glonium stellatum]
MIAELPILELGSKHVFMIVQDHMGLEQNYGPGAIYIRLREEYSITALLVEKNTWIAFVGLSTRAAFIRRGRVSISPVLMYRLGNTPIILANNLGPQTAFPIPEGILNYRGSNTIALSLWAFDVNGAKLGNFFLAVDGVA